MPEPGDPGSPDVPPRQVLFSDIVIAIFRELIRLHPELTLVAIVTALGKFSEDIWEQFRKWFAEEVDANIDIPPGGIINDPRPGPSDQPAGPDHSPYNPKEP